MFSNWKMEIQDFWMKILFITKSDIFSYKKSKPKAKKHQEVGLFRIFLECYLF